jgi:hypothetical protein
MNEEYTKVRSSIGFEMPLKNSDYAKDKATTYITFTMKVPKLKEDEYQAIANKKAQQLAEWMVEVLVEKGKNLIDALVDKRVEDIRKEYEQTLAKAREEYLKLKEQTDGTEN